MGVREIKHASKLAEWSAKIAECRSSGKTVKAWCAEQAISIKTYYYWEKQYIEDTTGQTALTIPKQKGQLLQINPEQLPDNMSAETGIRIRHGESELFLPVGCSTETVAELVKALNRYA